jgi:NADH-quinone oxidoreductase subunit G
LSVELAARLGVAAGDQVKVKQGEGNATWLVRSDCSCITGKCGASSRRTSGSTAGLGAMFGAISVEKA